MAVCAVKAPTDGEMDATCVCIIASQSHSVGRTEARYESGALGGLPRTFRLLSSFGEARPTWIEARFPSPRLTARVSTGHP